MSGILWGLWSNGRGAYHLHSVYPTKGCHRKSYFSIEPHLMHPVSPLKLPWSLFIWWTLWVVHINISKSQCLCCLIFNESFRVFPSQMMDNLTDSVIDTEPIFVRETLNGKLSVPLISKPQFIRRWLFFCLCCKKSVIAGVPMASGKLRGNILAHWSHDQ